MCFENKKNSIEEYRTKLHTYIYRKERRGRVRDVKSAIKILFPDFRFSSPIYYRFCSFHCQTTFLVIFFPFPSSRSTSPDRIKTEGMPQAHWILEDLLLFTPTQKVITSHSMPKKEKSSLKSFKRIPKKTVFTVHCFLFWMIFTILPSNIIAKSLIVNCENGRKERERESYTFSSSSSSSSILILEILEFIKKLNLKQIKG